MNTIQIQLIEKDYDTLMSLLDYAQENIHMDMEANRKRGDEDTDNLAGFLGGHEDVVKELISTKTYLWSSSHGTIDLEIAAEHVDGIAVPGDNEDACRFAIGDDGYLRHQLEKMDMAAAREHLKDAGIDEVDEKSDEMVRIYTLWMACGDIADERNQED